MADINDFPSVPGYVSIKQAAEILGITDKRVYRYIDLGRLTAFKSGGVFLLPEDEVKRFKLHPPGRARKAPPGWRAYNPRSRVFATEIHVQVREGQHERLREKLTRIQEEQQYTFPGTLARYVTQRSTNLHEIRFFFIWKDSDMPDEATRQDYLSQFRQELADVIDWETACYHTDEMLLHT